MAQKEAFFAPAIVDPPLLNGIEKRFRKAQLPVVALAHHAERRRSRDDGRPAVRDCLQCSSLGCLKHGLNVQYFVLSRACLGKRSVFPFSRRKVREKGPVVYHLVLGLARIEMHKRVRISRLVHMTRWPCVRRRCWRWRRVRGRRPWWVWVWVLALARSDPREAPSSSRARAAALPLDCTPRSARRRRSRRTADKDIAATRRVLRTSSGTLRHPNGVGCALGQLEVLAVQV
jgi:hypothetical protein